MSGALRELSRKGMVGLAAALRAGRVAPPFHRPAVRQHCPDAVVDRVVAALCELHAAGVAPANIATMLELLAAERLDKQVARDAVSLVMSPPEQNTENARTTGEVVQELFREAQRSVLVASYAIDDGAKAEALFGDLAARMDAEPNLEVTLIANIHREYGDTAARRSLILQFRDRFKKKVWPGERLPAVYFDPRSIAEDKKKRSVQHAKCVVVDEAAVFLTSANFTEAAQERNIEAGVLLRRPDMAKRVRRHFLRLIEGNGLLELDLQ